MQLFEHSAATIRAGALSGLTGLLAARGTCGTRVMERCGVDPQLLLQSEQRIELHRYLHLLRLAAETSGDPGLGLRLGYLQSVESMGRVGDLAWCSPTLGAAVGVVSRGMFLHQDGASLRIEARARSAAIVYECGHADADEARQDVALALAKMLRFGRAATGRNDWAPAEVHFRHRAPRGADAAPGLFGTLVRYGQRDNAILIPRALLQLPIVAGARPQPQPQLRPRDWAAAVRDEIGRAMAQGRLNGAAVAERLGCSERGLQRRLQRSGVSFAALVEQARSQLAARLLADTALSMTDISERLGYSEQSAFSRAFRRWTGSSPQTYRTLHGSR